MDDDLTEYPTQRVRLQQCNTCGRQFNAESLKKHQAICRQVTNKKRKIFDAGKQRATDSDVPYKSTKRTMQIYTGEVRAQDDRSRSKSKPNWREKHTQLIKSIREARSVTLAMKTGAPLPAFRPSEVPSDYVACPHCRRNFNAHVAERHIPFCQAQHQRKQVPSSRPNQNFDRGRTLPPQNSSNYKQQQSSSSGMYSNSHDNYNNGYKHSNSAPMVTRRNPSELQPPPPPRKATGDGGGAWGGFRKFFGFGPKEEPAPKADYYQPEDEDYYEPPVRRPAQQPVLMRTGRTQENTSLNVRARQKNDEVSTYGRGRRVLPPPAAPPSYNQQRSQYGNGQYNSSRPTAVGRPPPSGVRCGDCGIVFNNASARYCPQCGSRR